MSALKSPSPSAMRTRFEFFEMACVPRARASVTSGPSWPSVVDDWSVMYSTSSVETLTASEKPISRTRSSMSSLYHSSRGDVVSAVNEFVCIASRASIGTSALRRLDTSVTVALVRMRCSCRTMS